MIVRPDALLIPSSRKIGGRAAERVNSICWIAEPLLGTDYAKGERAWIRSHGQYWLFVTPRLEDTMCFEGGHPLCGHPRYTWVLQGDGMQFGFLVECARDR